ncbi:MAG: ACP S-malonyltransferase [Chloroflexi bacterium]|nr:ACP S-malonyltransferase [Chloroflexota bacterium]
MNSEELKAPTQNKLAFVFPGSGSQYVGMGRDIYDQYPAARRLFEEADAVLQFPLSRLCFEGPEEELMDAVNVQPAMVTVSAALLVALREHSLLGSTRQGVSPAFVAGHSTGEYTALFAAAVLDFPSLLRLVRERGRLMREAGNEEPGAMAAVLGLEAAPLHAICAAVGDVWVANDNAPGQIVLSGSKPALEKALQLAMERGAKRVVPLAVNIASHSPLMGPAAASFAAILDGLTLKKAQVPIVGNVTATALVEPADIRRELVQHLTSSVRWVESVRYMIAHGVQTFIEIGPKDVLSGLIKRIDRNVRVFHVGTVQDIEALEGL